jgi:hypothetical protein
VNPIQVTTFPFLEILLCNKANVRTFSSKSIASTGWWRGERQQWKAVPLLQRSLTVQELKGSGRSLLQDRISALAMREDLSKFFSPTDAQLDSIKNNFKFSLKLTSRHFKTIQLCISWWKKNFDNYQDARYVCGKKKEGRSVQKIILKPTLIINNDAKQCEGTQYIIFRGPVTTPHRLAEFTIRLNYFAHTFTNHPESHIDRELLLPVSWTGSLNPIKTLSINNKNSGLPLFQHTGTIRRFTHSKPLVIHGYLPYHPLFVFLLPVLTIIFEMSVGSYHRQCWNMFWGLIWLRKSTFQSPYRISN